MRALKLSSRRQGARLKPEDRPQYTQRPIMPVVELRFPLPPSTNSLFANVAGRGRIKTPRYRGWRQQAVLAIEIQRPRPGRIAGPCDVVIHLPPFCGDIDNRIKPCLDVAVAAGILADDGQRYVRNATATQDRGASEVRMILTGLPVEDQDRAEIEVRAAEGQSPAYIAVALGLNEGQVLTVLVGIGR
ncbi:RusA family crossover junction endodeoxyribonuclease [Methylorubrum populi]